MNTSKALLAAAILLCANVASANHHEGAHEGCPHINNIDFSMKAMDTDKDGTISLSEYAATKQTEINDSFKHLDANNDGKLDAKEQQDVEDVLKSIHSKPETPASTM
jgi:Ca2+-binding EF-hand superfamily protein